MNEKNLNQEEVLELVKNFPEEPLFNKVIITANLESPDGGLVLSENVLSDIQYIVAKGSSVNKDLELGQKVRIDLEKLMVRVPAPNNSHEFVTQIKVEAIDIDGMIYAIIEDRFIKTKIKTV